MVRISLAAGRAPLLDGLTRLVRAVGAWTPT
jgi:hypothetical protein